MPDPIDELENFSHPRTAHDTRCPPRRYAAAATGSAGATTPSRAVGGLAVVARHRGAVRARRRRQRLRHRSGPHRRWTGSRRSRPTSRSPRGCHAGTEDVRRLRSQQSTDVCAGQGWTPPRATRQARPRRPERGRPGPRDRSLPDRLSGRTGRHALEEQVAACEAQTAGSDRVGRAPRRRTERRAVPRLTSIATPTGGDADVVRVVRIGNAVLQDTAYAMGAGDPAVLQGAADRIGERAVDDRRRDVHLLGRGLRAGRRAVAGRRRAHRARRRRIPDDFPLEKGLPTSQENGEVGLEGPATTWISRSTTSRTRSRPAASPPPDCPTRSTPSTPATAAPPRASCAS